MKDDAEAQGHQVLTPAAGKDIQPPPPAPPANPPSAREPFLLEPYRTAPDPEPSRRNYALFTGAGLVVGLGVGLLIPYVELRSTDLAEAVSSCGLDEEWGVDLTDDGQRLRADGQGEDAYAPGIPYSDSLCLLSAVHAPYSVVSQVGSTRALDGIQSAQFGDVSVYWRYHPEDGLDMVFDIVA